MTQTGPGMGRVALFDIHSILCIVTATSPGLALVLALFELSNNEHLNQNQHWNLTAEIGPRRPKTTKKQNRRYFSPLVSLELHLPRLPRGGCRRGAAAAAAAARHPRPSPFFPVLLRTSPDFPGLSPDFPGPPWDGQETKTLGQPTVGALT